MQSTWTRRHHDVVTRGADLAFFIVRVIPRKTFACHDNADPYTALSRRVVHDSAEKLDFWTPIVVDFCYPSQPLVGCQVLQGESERRKIPHQLLVSKKKREGDWRNFFKRDEIYLHRIVSGSPRESPSRPINDRQRVRLPSCPHANDPPQCFHRLPWHSTPILYIP